MFLAIDFVGARAYTYARQHTRRTATTLAARLAMPRLVAGGPDIPNEVLDSVEDERVVFFCGAGVSVPAGLPLFRGLVDQVYARLPTGRDRKPAEEAEYCNKSYDRVLALLEHRIDGTGANRGTRVRRTVAEILTPSHAPLDLGPHKSLLSLATLRKGGLRLVTTNFDNLFVQAGLDYNLLDTAPRLPVPNPTTWRSAVHLHGRLGDPRDPDHRCLVLTAADFGAAYLSEGWAARFVTELFRHFVVVFVGYSLEDPVMRYLVDALAAARAEGLGFHAPYTFVVESPNATQTWDAKNVKAIVYDPVDRHRRLWESFEQWAELRRTGLLGRRSLAIAETRGTPAAAGPEAVERVVWALRDKDGRVAKALADELEPAPIEWLEVFDQSGLLSLPPPLVQDSLNAVPDSLGENLRIKEVQQLTNVPILDNGLVANGPSALHPISAHLSRWAAKHLSKEELLEWVLKKGPVLHWEFRREVRCSLRETPIEPQALGRLWRVLSSDAFAARVSAGAASHRSYESVTTSELSTAAGLMGLVEHLRPIPILETSYRSKERVREIRAAGDEVRMHHLVKVRLGTGDEIRGLNALPAIATTDFPSGTLSALCDLLTSLVHEALQWFAAFEHAEAFEDPSLYDLPSISSHEQNRYRPPWCALVEGLRDATVSLARERPDEVAALVARWRTIPFPLFRRLVLFAATDIPAISAAAGVEILLEREEPWLWSIFTARECHRFIRKRGSAFSESEVRRLEEAILRGPRREGFQEMEDPEWNRIRDHAVWLRLAKLKESGVRLSDTPGAHLEELSARYPWRIQADRSDEFHFWDGDAEWITGESGPYHTAELCAMDASDLADLLRGDAWHADPFGEVQFPEAWADACGRCPERCVEALAELAGQRVWPREPWRRALGVLGRSERLPPDGHERVAALIDGMGNEAFGDVSAAIADFLHSAVHVALENSPTMYWRLWDRAFDACTAAESIFLTPVEPLMEAINHGCGKLAEALCDALWGRSPTRGSRIPDDLRVRFDHAAAGTSRGHHLARIAFTVRLRGLFLVDPEWTRDNLIVRLSGAFDGETVELWQAYFFGGQWDVELLHALKSEFLRAFKNSATLGESQGRARSMLGYMMVQAPDELGYEEARHILGGYSSDELNDVARSLWQYVRNADESVESLWRERILPVFQNAWPPDEAKRSRELSYTFVRLALNAGDAFPEVVRELGARSLFVPSQGGLAFYTIAEAMDEVGDPPPVFLDTHLGESDVQGDIADESDGS